MTANNLLKTPNMYKSIAVGIVARVGLDSHGAIRKWGKIVETKYKVMFGGVLCGIVILSGGFAFWSKMNITKSQAVPSSNVDIQVVSSKPAYTAQQSQVISAVQQILQGGASASQDASGFVQTIYAQVGIQLPRTVAEQAQVGTAIDAPEKLQQGDLVCFNLNSNQPNTATFDGIYMGNGQFAAVTTHGLMQISLNDSYWSSKFVFGRRIL